MHYISVSEVLNTLYFSVKSSQYIIFQCLKFSIHYISAIAAKVIQTRTMDDQNSFVKVTVSKVLKRGKLHIHEFRDTNLWVKSNCVCPKLKKNREYFITGYEDIILNRLIYTPTSLVARWNTRMEAKVKVIHFPTTQANPDHYWPASETSCKWRFAGGPIVARDCMLAGLFIYDIYRLENKQICSQRTNATISKKTV